MVTLTTQNVDELIRMLNDYLVALDLYPTYCRWVPAEKQVIRKQIAFLMKAKS